VQRFLRFNAVGLVGMAFQLAALWLLTREGIGYFAASSAAIVLTVFHNFIWHWCWTWADRSCDLTPSAAFVRFFGANGLVSLTSNTVLMPLMVGVIGLPAVAANLLVIAIGGLLNFGLADRIAFPFASPVSSKHADREPAPHGA
jgi:putative flippase GtrA